ncbi:hypothetical protein HY491_04880 [Candidatus Woesearchaeota archaeon]|nr:hypothetical protein [Candidatus Woesearchaeota archaeon]
MHDTIAIANEILERIAEKPESPEICKGCFMFQRHQKGCWFYWDHKKFCSQYAHNGF